MGPPETFLENVSGFADAVRSARPVEGGPPVRMPFDRSRRERKRRLAENAIEVPESLVHELTLIGSVPSR